MRRVTRRYAVSLGNNAPSLGAFAAVQEMTVSELMERTDNGRVWWDMWHRNLVGRPWRPYDNALDGTARSFGPSLHDDYSEDANANATGIWQPIRERI